MSILTKLIYRRGLGGVSGARPVQGLVRKQPSLVLARDGHGWSSVAQTRSYFVCALMMTMWSCSLHPGSTVTQSDSLTSAQGRTPGYCLPDSSPRPWAPSICALSSVHAAAWDLGESIFLEVWGLHRSHNLLPACGIWRPGSVDSH